MKILALLLGLSVASIARAEDVPVQGDAWQGMKRSVKTYQDRSKPAAVDPAPVGRLWRRLARDGNPGVTPQGESILSYEHSVEPDANGAAQNRLVYVVELPEPAASEDVRPAVLTRTFSRLVASSEDWSLAADGARRVEIWHYVLSLDGTLLSAVRQEIVMRAAADGARARAEPDPARSRTIRMRPSDPVVLKRWNKLAQELLRLGPTISL